MINVIHLIILLCNIGDKLASQFGNTINYDDITNSIHNQHNSLFINPVNNQEIIDIVTNCKSKKILDYHNLSFRCITNIIISISQPLTILINNIFVQGIFPNCLNIAKVIVLHKGGNYEDPSNFRPISIVSQFNKQIEKLLKTDLIVLLLNIS